MPNLFIIGNGFDISHGLKTNYSDFRDYLNEKYSKSDIKEELPTMTELSNGEYGYDDNIVARFIIKELDKVTKENWKDIENELGRLNFEDFFFYTDDLDEKEIIKCWCYNEEVAEDIYESMERIKEFFEDWVKSINIFKIKEKEDFKNIINSKTDFFINFNYTLTLEEVYKVKNVCHIHGTQDSKIYFGHGNEKSTLENYKDIHLGSEDDMEELHINLRKNTEEAFNNNINFFKSLKEISSIYSYGFSFSEVDLFYIRKIFEIIKTENIIWNLNDFDDKNKRNEYIEKIINCGFKGKFSTYHID